MGEKQEKEPIGIWDDDKPPEEPLMQPLDKKKMKPLIEAVQKLGEQDLTFSVSVTREVVIAGTKNWIGVSPSFYRGELTLLDALEIASKTLDDYCKDKGAVAVQARREEPTARVEIPVFDGDLGWRTYSNKQLCVVGEEGWAFVDNRANPSDAKVLDAMIENGVKQVRMLGTVFDVRKDKTGRFFQRNLPKQKGA